MRTIDDVIRSLPSPQVGRLEAPPFQIDESEYVCGTRSRIGLAVESMRRHTTDEGWQLFQALRTAGYGLWGGGNAGCWFDGICSHVPSILAETNPSVVVLQDKREWIGRTAGPGFDQRERFTNVAALRGRPDVFKVTVLKDAQNDLALHVDAATEIDCHAWICYYHPRIVAHLAPFVRPEHLVRTWHTVDKDLVPPFRAENRADCVISGALSNAYPLRKRVWESPIPMYRMWHPGYGRAKCHTPSYLKLLSGFKVAVCTSSVYGYALRKIVEATACGCRVITDLPVDEVIPMVDENLFRVSPDVQLGFLEALIEEACRRYDPEAQRWFAAQAKTFYDYRAMGKRLADDVEAMRRKYNANQL